MITVNVTKVKLKRGLDGALPQPILWLALTRMLENNVLDCDNTDENADAENIDYLRGFIDGYGGEEPHGVMPDGFNDINEVWDKMYELKGNEA